MNFDVTPELISRWNHRPATMSEDFIRLPVRVRAASNHFLLIIGAETFIGRRDTVGKTDVARDKVVDWVVSPVGSENVVGQGPDPEKLIAGLVAQKESLVSIHIVVDYIH